MVSDKYKNKYRIESTRLQHWDYRWDGAYFITICTKDRLHYFGEVINQTMVLSNTGVLANVFWYEIKNHAQNVELGEFIVMPNHIHGIIILKNNYIETGHAVETGHALSLANKTIGQQRFQNIGKNSISSIVGGFKSAVTKHANRLDFEFKWQTSFHDHIIRNAKSFDNISSYIVNNPLKWNEDKYFS